MSTHIGTVSLLVATLNEARYIKGCLDTLIAQDYEPAAVDIIVIDGGSADETCDIVRDYAQRFGRIRLLHNPKRRQSAAYNIGIAATHSDFVLVIGAAHSIYERGYVRQCINLLVQSGAENVGGVQCAESPTYLGTAIALATCSRFGVGDAKFRYARTPTVAESVFGGAWKRATLEAIGGYNEDLLVSEDYELNYRIRQRGGKIIVSPDIRVVYFCRDSIRTLGRQYFRYGYWKLSMIILHPRSIRWRNLIPPVFVAALIASVVLVPKHPSEALLVPTLYLLLNTIVSLTIASRRGVKFAFVLPVVFLVVHVCWGSGFLWCALVNSVRSLRSRLARLL
jgi:succinoglycan biosynthesis protein ExoA